MLKTDNSAQNRSTLQLNVVLIAMKAFYHAVKICLFPSILKELRQYDMSVE